MNKAVRHVRRESNLSVMGALIRARRRFGGTRRALIDGDGRTLTYTETIRAVFALGHALTRYTKRGECVGIMLPTSIGAIVAFFALLAYGRIPAMMNFTAGPRTMKAACAMARVKTVLTANSFLDIANLHGLADQLSETATLVPIDVMREELTLRDKLMALIGSAFPALVMARTVPSKPAVILYTSGTEGNPKGVVLSHANMLANVAQIDWQIELEPQDVFFNPLPVFHCYGLTAGTLYPLFVGKPVALYPSPLHVKIVPRRIFETQATVLFATDTFLQQYARNGKDKDLQSLRFAVCGAERVRDETRTMVKNRFDLDVLEGYGVTEASPVIAVNQPGDIRTGTVGRLLPGIETRIEPVEGLEEGGCLFVRGPNIMLGYVSVERPGEVLPLEDGWHNTGDVVSFDSRGHMVIRDRIKRFAKVGGEMVSLSVVENCAQAIWPDHAHAAIALPDPSRGEQIILATTCATADPSRMKAWAQSHGVSPLAIPKRVAFVPEIPVLGTGKTNYVAVKLLLAQQLEAPPQAVEASSDTSGASG